MQRVKYPALIIIVAALTTLINVWIDEDGTSISLGREVRAGDTTSGIVADLGIGDEDEGRTVFFDRPGRIVHSEALQLQGGLDFDGEAGDRLLFVYTGDAWVEVGRFLVP